MPPLQMHRRVAIHGDLFPMRINAHQQVLTQIRHQHL